jgi:hypothetical protein
MRPSLTHACAVWMPLYETCKQTLESWQYRAAKIVIKTRINIPKAAPLLERRRIRQFSCLSAFSLRKLFTWKLYFKDLLMK